MLKLLTLYYFSRIYSHLNIVCKVLLEHTYYFNIKSVSSMTYRYSSPSMLVPVLNLGLYVSKLES